MAEIAAATAALADWAEQLGERMDCAAGVAASRRAATSRPLEEGNSASRAIDGLAWSRFGEDREPAICPIAKQWLTAQELIDKRKQ